MAFKTAISTGLVTDSLWEASAYPSPLVTTTPISVTPGGVFTGTFTALNTTNKTTGVWLFVRTKPTIGWIVTLQEATVDTVCTVTISPTELTFGWNYVRFPTPYQWTATTANRYRFKIQTLLVNSGTFFCQATSQVSFLDTYDSVTTLGTTDNMWIGGTHTAAGRTPITLEVTGTTTVHGDGALKGSFAGGELLRTGLFGIGVAGGGKLVWDKTANTTLTTRGTVVTYEGGIYERNGNTSDRSIVARHIIDCETANGNYFFNNCDGGIMRMVSGDLPTHYAELVSGSGTTGSNLIVDRTTNWEVNDRIIVEGSAYNQVEDKYIRTVINPTTFTLSDTPGGAESGFSTAKPATATITNITRNSVLESLVSNRSYFLQNYDMGTGDCDLTGAFFENPSLASGIGGINIKTTAGTVAKCDYAVLTNGISNRQGFFFSNSKTPDTITGLVTYLAASSNISSGSIALTNTSNHVFNDCFQYSTAAVGLVLNVSYNNTFNNYRSIASNSSNTPAGNAIQFVNSGSNTFNGARINAARWRAIHPQGTSQIVFNNSTFGNIATNVIDIDFLSDTSNEILFNNCTFDSPTLINNYLNQLEGSITRFHKYQGIENNHRWYTINGVGYSEADGTGSLRAALNPLTTQGLRFEYRIPVNIGEVISVFGKFWCNADFLADGSSTMVAELFLPGSLTPDQTYNMTKTTDFNSDNAVYRLGLVNTSTVQDVAIIRLTAKSTNPAAMAYVDDLNGGTNAISALDIWFQGQPLAFQLSPATLGDPAANAAAVWGYTDVGTLPNTMGQRQVDAVDNQKLPNLLIKDKLS